MRVRHVLPVVATAVVAYLCTGMLLSVGYHRDDQQAIQAAQADESRIWDRVNALPDAPTLAAPGQDIGAFKAGLARMLTVARDAERISIADHGRLVAAGAQVTARSGSILVLPEHALLSGERAGIDHMVTVAAAGGDYYRALADNYSWASAMTDIIVAINGVTDQATQGDIGGALAACGAVDAAVQKVVSESTGKVLAPETRSLTDTVAHQLADYLRLLRAAQDGDAANVQTLQTTVDQERGSVNDQITKLSDGAAMVRVVEPYRSHYQKALDDAGIAEIISWRKQGAPGATH